MGLVAPRHVGPSQTRARTRVPCIGRRILNHCATREVPPTASEKFTSGFSDGNSGGPTITPRAVACVRGGGDEVLEVGAEGWGAWCPGWGRNGIA